MSDVNDISELKNNFRIRLGSNMGTRNYIVSQENLFKSK